MSLFITFEGPEGSGKTTQIRLLAQALRTRNLAVLDTREPGGTPIGNAIRSILLDPAYNEMSPRAETLLFNAARAQIVDQVIQPALQAGKIVLCDRYIDSTLAYQGYGRGQPLAALQALIDYATAGLKPDLTIFLNLDPAEGLQRKHAHRLEEWNRMEEEALAFHQVVRQGYLQLAAAEPARWLVLDATQTPETVQTRIWAGVAALLKTNIDHKD